MAFKLDLQRQLRNIFQRQLLYRMAILKRFLKFQGKQTQVTPFLVTIHCKKQNIPKNKLCDNVKTIVIFFRIVLYFLKRIWKLLLIAICSLWSLFICNEIILLCFLLLQVHFEKQISIKRPCRPLKLTDFISQKSIH